MLELLAPAGSKEALTAAVQNGADAVYLGYGDFNARRNAKNFSPDELAEAISYCHLRGVKVYLTLNTLLTDRELPAAARHAAQAAQMGVDAVLVQDLGVARMLRQTIPALDLHASTQMTIHSLDGVKFCADLGMKRVVLSRELSRGAMEHICTHSPIEIEVFAHGALCMSYSGQCMFSCVIGGRSGNRGLCAQPCRLPYGWGDRPDSYPLSLKDLSLVDHLRELRKLGVACVKIEGRMKRPEYVAIVTGIYARAIREARAPTPDELRELERAFSRQGFTDGYYADEQGADMFGVREGEKEPAELFAKARASYAADTRLTPVNLYALVRTGEPVQVGVQDEAGRVATAAGDIPEAAHKRAVTREVVEEQISKTGGTPYQCAQAKALVEPGLSVPLSALNALRRRALEDLSAQRTAMPPREIIPFQPGVRYENPKGAPILNVSLLHANQLTPELTAMVDGGLIYLPAHEIDAQPGLVADTLRRGARVAVTLPRILWDKELDELSTQLRTAVSLGITDALIGSWGALPAATAAGLRARGDWSLGVYNSQALKELRRLGFISATASPELKLAQIRDLSKAVELELLVYGRLPLMITENCIIHQRGNRCVCENYNRLIDRTGASFPVIKAPGCRNEILNAQKLYLADKTQDYARVGAWAARLMFTTENALECVRVTERYLQRGNWEPNEFTRGLYYRDVD